MSKITTFLSDMQEFFNGNSEHAATQSICNAVAGVRMSERHTLGVESRPNQVYRLLDVFQCLLMCPFFLVKNVSALSASPLHGLMEAGKDVFYRFMERADIDWRKALWHITLQLWNKICVRSEHSLDETCLIVDDTDLGKTGRRIERISRIHSHLQHKAVLGFKMLALVVTDGFSHMLLDFALLGEKGKKGKYGMSDKELSRRRQPKRAQTSCHGHLRNTVQPVRFLDYETVGGLFREISKETVRQSIAQQLWGKVQEMLTAIAEVCGLVDEDLYEIIINKTEQVENMFAAFNLKQAS